MYLFRVKGMKVAAHIWLGDDTACRMWSTGGMDKARQWKKSESPEGRRICMMCRGAKKAAPVDAG